MLGRAINFSFYVRISNCLERTTIRIFIHLRHPSLGHHEERGTGPQELCVTGERV